MLVAVKRQSLRREVEQIIRRYIVSAGLREADRLPAQRDLAGYLQVSRTVVREALSSLESQGIIDIRVGDGVFIRDTARLTVDQGGDLPETNGLPTRDLSEFMTSLYLGLSELICERVTDEDLARLERLLDDMERKLRAGRTILAEVQHFFWQLALLSRNAIVLQLKPLRSEMDRRALLVQSSIIGRPTDQALEHLAAHRDLVGAIRTRDPERLRAALRAEFRGERRSAPERPSTPGPPEENLEATGVESLLPTTPRRSQARSPETRSPR